MNPTATFTRKKKLETNSKSNKSEDSITENISFIEYYRTRYSRTIKNPTQPLFEAIVRRGDKRETIYLVPELCMMTGLYVTDYILVQLI